MKRTTKRILTAACLLLAAPLSYAEYQSSITGYSIEKSDVKVSPNGANLAMALNKDGQRVLFLLNTDTREAISGVNLGDNQDVGNFFWANNERLILEVLHRESWDETPKFYGELFAVDSDGSDRELLYGYRVNEQQVGSLVKTRKPAYGWARVVSLLPNEKNMILISSSDLPGGKIYFEQPLKRKYLREMDINDLHSTVHELNLHTGKVSSKRTFSPEPNTQYITDENGQLKYAYGAKPGAQTKLYRYQDPEWVITDLGQSTDFMPVTFSADFTQVSYIDSVGDKNRCLYRHDFSSGQTKQLSQTCDLDVSQVLHTQDKTQVYGVAQGAVNGGVPSYEIIDTSTVEGDFFSQITGMFEGFDIRINSRSDKGDYWVIRASVPDKNDAFYLYSRKTNEFIQVL